MVDFLQTSFYIIVIYKIVPWISDGWWFSKVDSYNPRKRWVHGYGWWTPALQGPKKNRKHIIYPKLQCLGFQGLVVRGVFNNNLLLSWKWTSISGSSCWWFVFVCLREFFGQKKTAVHTRLQLVRLHFLEVRAQLGGGFKYFLFSPLFGEDSHFD